MIMKAIDLIKSFMSQAKWGQLATDGRPFRGVKWLTQKQVVFLKSLIWKEKLDLDFFTIDDYEVSLGKVSPLNGCASISFLNTKHDYEN